ncbi:MAG: haloacid dehalogenase type II [Nitrospinota bacterium]
MGYDWLTFDCYGTLIDWEAGIRASLEKLVLEKKPGVDPATLPARYITTELAVEAEGYRPYREVLRISVERLLKATGISLTRDEASVLVRTLPTWQPFPDVRKTLSRLGERYRLAILSNIDEDLIAQSVKVLRVRFDAVITAEQVRSFKPAPAHWRRMLEVCGTSVDRVLHVAASLEHDARPAKRLGFDCVWVDRHGSGEPGDVRPDHIFRDLNPLESLLLGGGRPESAPTE